MNHYLILRFLLITFILAALQVSARQPNVLLIQTDDLGYDDLSINGNTCSKTPNLDQLARTSVRFSNFMVNSVCAPTRASLLTGRDHWRTGCEGLHGGKEFVHLDERTFGNLFQDAGYATGMWGKWHSGKSDGYWPWDRGFDEGFYAKLYKYYPAQGYYNEYPKMTVHEGKWSPRVLANYTIDFISRNKDKPFLAYLSFQTCHSTWSTPDEYKKDYMQDGRTEAFATLLGMLEFMDDEIGRVLRHLDDLGLAQDTVVLFMSDNGPNKAGSQAQKGADKITEEEWSLRNNHGYLGAKSKLWQNGIKSPLYVRWLNKYKPADVDRLVTVTDILPTLIDIAGIDLPADNLPLDGRSVTAYLEGDTSSLPEREGIFSHWFPAWERGQYDPVIDRSKLEIGKQKVTLINEKHKYIQNEYAVPGSPTSPDKTYLIDRVLNPMESVDIKDSHPELVSQMQQKLAHWWDGLLDSPHAFTPTVFQIGWKGKKRSEILAFGPSRTVGVQNGGHSIGGWNEVGDAAEYPIHVHRAGDYRVSVALEAKALPVGTFLKITCGANSLSSELVNKKNESLGTLHLPEGSHVLRVELVSIEGKTKPDLSFTSFNFDRL